MTVDVAAMVTALAGIVGTAWAIWRVVRSDNRAEAAAGAPPAWLAAQTEFYVRLVDSQRTEIDRLAARVRELETRVRELEAERSHG